MIAWPTTTRAAPLPRWMIGSISLISPMLAHQAAYVGAGASRRRLVAQLLCGVTVLSQLACRQPSPGASPSDAADAVDDRLGARLGHSQISFSASSVAIQRATSLAAGVPERGSLAQCTLASMRAAGRAVTCCSSDTTSDSIVWDM